MEEYDRTIGHLDFIQTKLTSLYDLSPDFASLLTSSGAQAGSSSPLRPKLHDASTPLTPQMKWNIINKSSKYSPKYNGNPDEMPLRSDEFHLFARILYRLSLLINDRLHIADRYGRGGCVASFLEVVCEPAVSYRQYERQGESRVVSLPPRLMLRPMASYRNMVYGLFAYFLIWLLGKGFVIKALVVVLIIWLVKTLLASPSRRPADKASDASKRAAAATTASQSFED